MIAIILFLIRFWIFLSSGFITILHNDIIIDSINKIGAIIRITPKILLTIIKKANNLHYTKKEFFTKNYIPTKDTFCLFLYSRFIFDAGDFAAFTQKHARFIPP